MCPSSPPASIRGTNERTPGLRPRGSRRSPTASPRGCARARRPARRRRRCCTPRGRRRTRCTSPRRGARRPRRGRRPRASPAPRRLVPRAAAARSSAGASMSASTTFMPSAAKRSAMAKPIPLAAPVTTATRPARSRISRSVAGGGEEAVAHLDGERALPARGERVRRVRRAARRALGHVELARREVADQRGDGLHVAPGEGMRADAMRRVAVVPVEVLDVADGDRLGRVLQQLWSRRRRWQEFSGAVS